MLFFNNGNPVRYCGECSAIYKPAIYHKGYSVGTSGTIRVTQKVNHNQCPVCGTHKDEKVKHDL